MREVRFFIYYSNNQQHTTGKKVCKDFSNLGSEVQKSPEKKPLGYYIVNIRTYLCHMNNNPVKHYFFRFVKNKATY